MTGSSIIRRLFHIPSPSNLILIFCSAAAVFVTIQVASQNRLSHLSVSFPSGNNNQPSLFLGKSPSSSRSPPHNDVAAAARIRTGERPKQQPQQQQQQWTTTTTTIGNQKKTMPAHHTVFSSSCNDQQHWESMVFFYHAVKQPGTVTRILSGCTAKEQEEQQTFFDAYIRPLAPSSFRIHFTPDFASVKKVNGPYKYMNKPFGLKYWMENGPLQMPNNKDAEDGIVILMDPDMILLRPLTYDFSDVDQYVWVEPNPKTRIVRHGYPIAQQDGYLSNEWMALNISNIVGTTQPVAPIPPTKEGMIHWNTGPPYLATVRDMYQIVTKWTDYTPRVLDEYPHLFGEMFGFIFATVQLQLPFTLIKSLVVSVTDTRREGWPLVDALPDDQICDPPKPGVKLPVALHYCERYWYGPNMFFSKYRVKKNIMQCDKSLLHEERLVAGQYDYTVTPPGAADNIDHWKPISEKIKKPHVGKRDAFMLCGLTRSINQALIHHKKLACPDGMANLVKNYTVYNDPSKY